MRWDDELGTRESVEVLFIVIDHLWANLTIRQIARIDRDAPEIGHAARIAHGLLWHEDEPARKPGPPKRRFDLDDTGEL